MTTLSQILCFCGAVTLGPNHQSVESAGFVQYRYEALSHKMYVLRLSTSDYLLDNADWRETRMRWFAEQFADQTCNGRFQLAKDELRGPKDRYAYTRQFIVRCR